MKSTRLITPLLVLAVTVLLIPDASWGGWQFFSLHPSNDYSTSEAVVVADGLIGGSATYEGQQHPVFWTATQYISYKDLSSNGIPAQIYGINRTLQAGIAGGYGAVWEGTPGFTWVNSSNNNVRYTNIYSLSGYWAGGSQYSNPSPGVEINDATIWNLAGDHTARPRMLSPANSQNSKVSAITGASGADPGIQAGQVDLQAALWRGTAESYVDLAPANSVRSAAWAAYGNEQGGWVETDTDVFRAGVWAGTADSFVSLHPDIQGITDSQIMGMTDGAEVGRVYVGPHVLLDSRAFLWWDSVTSYVNLHDLLPADYAYSRATSADWFEGKLWVAGTAASDTSMREEAVLWVYTPEAVPEPGTCALFVLGIVGLSVLKVRARVPSQTEGF